jgi:hypothetical protein
MNERKDWSIDRKNVFGGRDVDTSYWREASYLWGRDFWKEGMGYYFRSNYSIHNLVVYILGRVQGENLKKYVFIDSFIEGFGGWEIYFVNYGVCRDKLKLNKVKIYKIGGTK